MTKSGKGGGAACTLAADNIVSNKIVVKMVCNIDVFICLPAITSQSRDSLWVYTVESRVPGFVKTPLEGIVFAGQDFFPV